MHFKKPYFILIILLLSGCSSMHKKSEPTYDEQSLYRMAQKAEQSGFKDTARTLYEKNLTQYNHQDSRFALFWLYRDLGKKEQLYTVLETQKWQNKVQKQCATAILAMDKKQWQKAYQQLNTLNLDKPNMLPCLQAKAVLLDKMHKPQQAQKLYLRLLQQDPKNFSLRYNLALSLISSKQAYKVPELFANECPNPTQKSCTKNMRQIIALAYGLDNQPEMARRYLKTGLNEKQIKGQLELYQKLRQVP